MVNGITSAGASVAARNSPSLPPRRCVRREDGRRFSSPARRRPCVLANLKRLERQLRFRCDRREEMPQIVMRDSRHPDQPCRPIHRFLAFPHEKHLCIFRLVRPLRSHTLKQRARLGDHRHAADFAVFGSPHRVASNHNHSAFELKIAPLDFPRFPDRQPVNAIPCTKSAQLRNRDRRLSPSCGRSRQIARGSAA